LIAKDQKLQGVAGAVVNAPSPLPGGHAPG